MNFIEHTFKRLASQLLHAPTVHRGSWQSIDVSGSRLHETFEMAHVTIDYEIPSTLDELQIEIQPNLPWADEHFAERVSGIPHNPPPSHVRWPYAQAANAQHTSGGKFSHTYPERFWPRRAGMAPEWQNIKSGMGQRLLDRRGIRYRYGDLSDVVNQLVINPLTRQAYLPVWFPEDTGATAGQRVPCTLGYHFLVTHGKMDIVYAIRSCDLLRHFQDDIYLAARLCQWMCEQYNEQITHPRSPDPEITLKNLRPGRLIMHISSLHAFMGDGKKLEQITKPPQCLFCDNRTAMFDRTVCEQCADTP